MSFDFFEQIFPTTEKPDILTEIQKLKAKIDRIDKHLKEVKIWDWKKVDGLKLFNIAKRIDASIRRIQVSLANLNNKIQDKTSKIQGELEAIQKILNKIQDQLNKIYSDVGYVNGDLTKLSCERQPYYTSGKGLILDAYQMMWHVARIGNCVSGLLEKKHISILGAGFDIYVPRPDRISQILDAVKKASNESAQLLQKLAKLDTDIRWTFSYFSELNKSLMNISSIMMDLVMDVSEALVKVSEAWSDVVVATQIPTPKKGTPAKTKKVIRVAKNKTAIR